jgi:transketolase
MTDPKTDSVKPTQKQMANAIRVLAMDGVEKARSGHPGHADGHGRRGDGAVLQIPEVRRQRPDWADRDRFILSAGHGSMLIYALLHLTGYKAATKQELSKFRQWGSKTAGHPEYGHMPGVETPPARWGRAWPPRSASPWPSGIWPPASATTSSTTAPGWSPATAA